MIGSHRVANTVMGITALVTVTVAGVLDNEARISKQNNTITKNVADTVFTQYNDGTLLHYQAQYPNGKSFECIRDAAGATHYTSSTDSTQVRMAACNRIAELYK